MKKLSKILVIVLCLSMLVACGKDKKGADPEPNQVVDNGGSENQNENQNQNTQTGDVKVESITCASEGYVAGDVDSKGVDGYFNLVKSYSPNSTCTIKCNITPDNASNKNLKYELSGKGYELQNKPADTFGYTYFYVINEDGSITVTFVSQSDVIVTIKSEDGNASLKVLLKVENKKPSIK